MLGDFLLDVLVSGLGPSTDRGLLFLLTIPALLLACMAGWLIVSSANPLDEALGLEVFAGSIIAGSFGLLVALLHLIREPADRVVAVLCLVINSAAVLTPLMWLATSLR